MKRRSRTTNQVDLLRPRLVETIDMRHELEKPADVMNWEWLEFFPSKECQPTTQSRLVARLMHLQNVCRLADDAVVARWVEKLYFQHFTGATFFQNKPPIHPSSLSRWRDSIGEDGAEWLLTKIIDAGQAASAMDDASLKRVARDTTVMEVATSHPTDAKLYEKARQKLIALAREGGLSLRQSHERNSPRLMQQVGR